MRTLTPYGSRSPRSCLLDFYARRYRSGRDLYDFYCGYQPGPGPKPAMRGRFWRWLFGGWMLD